MYHSVISHSPDLTKLLNDGYELELKDEHLLIHGVPYVNSNKQIERGTLVSPLTITGNKTGPPKSHVVFFDGSQPCDKNGKEIPQLIHTKNGKALSAAISVQRSFSNKPPGGFKDFYAKMTSYVRVISAPARSMDRTVTARTYRIVPFEAGQSVFHYPDTNSSRAEITAVSERLSGLKIGIVGLGGTGSYVLDFVAKCPVAEIHLFDGDQFYAHNAFKAPSAPSVELLNQGTKKVEYLSEMYSRMHRGIVPHPEYVGSENFHEFSNYDFVFVCIDKGKVKQLFYAHLEDWKIPFVDVGLGVNVTEKNELFGNIRTTTSLEGLRTHVNSRVSFEDEDEDGAYATNIQIAELNALNASIAVIEWKKHFGFYASTGICLNSVHSVHSNSIQNEKVET